jgi:hypothetical protein
MGNFYVNYTLRGPSQESVANALAGRKALITPSEKDCVVVFDEASESQDLSIVSDLASRLSSKLQCPLLAVLNHDDDILYYQLYIEGKLSDEYNSTPNCFEASEEIAPPSGGDAHLLCITFGVPDQAQNVETILRSSFLDNGSYGFAFMRHADLVKALSISAFGIGTGYCSFNYNEYPQGLAKDNLLDASEIQQFD